MDRRAYRRRCAHAAGACPVDLGNAP